MNIESLHVENFKSIRELDVEFSNLNVFVGRNAAGKSNLFEVFQFLRDARSEGIEDAIQLQGGVEYLRNTRIGIQRNLCIGLKMAVEVESGGSHESPEKETSNIKAELQFDEDTYDFKYDIDYPPSSEGDIAQSSVEMNNYSIERIAQNSTESAAEGPSAIEVIDGYDPDARRYHQIGKTFDIDPRKITTDNSLAARTDLQPDGSNLALVIKKLLEDKERKRKFLSLVSDVLPFISDTKVDAMPDQSLFLQILENFDPDEDQYIPAEMLSDGTLRVLALIYILYFSDHEKVFIEEPGRNIHPSLIANLMMKVKDAAENTDKQIFLTTHNVEVVKYAPLESIRLVSRDDDGFTQVEKPAESERVQTFLDEGVRIDDMYTENLLGE
ncbi:AAA family ATPase [Halobaculum sp. MBLA0143]|uniref:AAA family ATPase n=1 Tax=Halobaculum sp. MBLA0143 TaxID=3079933 RepID=UPI003525C049